MKKNPFHHLSAWIGLVLFTASLCILYQQLHAYRFREIVRAFHAIPFVSLAAAVGLTLFDYWILTGCETLCFQYIEKPMKYHKIFTASFIAYAFANSAGFAGISAGSIRYRFYSAWELSTLDIAKVVAYANATFLLGLLALAGLFFTFKPLLIPAFLHLPFETTRPLGFSFLAVVALYLLWTVLQKESFRVRDWEFRLPSLKLSLTQIVLTGIDITTAGSALFVLLPHASVSFPVFITIYLLSITAGVLSQIPGGLGVFETILLFTLPKTIPRSTIAGALMAYRLIYYLLPLALASLLMGIHELRHRKDKLKEITDLFTNVASHLSPHFISLMVFLGGLILLFSGATPAAGERLAWIKDFVPLPVIEASHFLGSLAGACLLILAWGLQRRLDAAYLSTVGMISGGILFSLIKGFDYEEALILSMMLLFILPARRHFYRKTSLLHEPFSRPWILAIILAFSSSVWLGFFAYKHVTYSHDLWWHFALREHAPRFMRATVGSIGAMLLFALVKLLSPARAKISLSSEAELVKAKKIVEKSPHTESNLALLGDKSFLFNDAENAFVMYGTQGSSWIAMGDPVGDEAEAAELIWRFHEMADMHGGATAFYNISKNNLYRYLDLGLSPLKIGEEARIFVPEFSIEGGEWKDLRYTLRQFEKETCTFEVIPAEQTASLLPELQKISDHWLQHKNTKEKGFSLGFFNPDYLKRYPIALVRKNNQIIGFANIWLGAEKKEFSVDLMRYEAKDAPRGIMDYLFIQLFLWGKEQGYQWFDFGVAPLSGLEDRTLAPLWSRLGAFLFRHGEHFYNFQGLRAYKEKFNPVWEPKYLISQGGFALPRILTDLAALISGSFKGMLKK